MCDTKPLPKPMLAHCQLHPREHTSEEFVSKHINLLSRNCIWKCHLHNITHFDQPSMSFVSNTHTAFTSHYSEVWMILVLGVVFSSIKMNLKGSLKDTICVHSPWCCAIIGYLTDGIFVRGGSEVEGFSCVWVPHQNVNDPGDRKEFLLMWLGEKSF